MPPDPQTQQHIAEIEAEQERRNEELQKRDYSRMPPQPSSSINR
jgi:hypothetical protein